jgi:hypothetical protein
MNGAMHSEAVVIVNAGSAELVEERLLADRFRLRKASNIVPVRVVVLMEPSCRIC